MPETRYLTLVSHYGDDKPPEVRTFVHEAQAFLSNALGDAFSKYDEDQVHATIIGLEGVRIERQVVNGNYVELRRQLKLMRFDEALRLLENTPLLPVTIRIGGYHDGSSYPFTSRGQHPYLRSFSFQGEIAVAMGWPIQGDRFPLVLDRLRRNFNRANMLHKYHATPGDVDNDFFFVLGNIDRKKVDENALQTVQQEMRDLMADRQPLNISVDKVSLKFVCYSKPSLPRDSSIPYPYDITADRLIDCYDLLA